MCTERRILSKDALEDETEVHNESGRHKRLRHNKSIQVKERAGVREKGRAIKGREQESERKARKSKAESCCHGGDGREEAEAESDGNKKGTFIPPDE